MGQRGEPGSWTSGAKSTSTRPRPAADQAKARMHIPAPPYVRGKVPPEHLGPWSCQLGAQPGRHF